MKTKKFLSLLLTAATVLMLVPARTLPTAAYSNGRDRPSLEEAADRGMYETLLALEKLPRVGMAMYTGAHPDDEGNNSDQGLTSYLSDSPRYAIDSILATFSWGEGGVNMIGPETFMGLGIVRAQEQYAANLLDRKYSVPFNMFDGGYMPGFEFETFDPSNGVKGRYNPDIILYQAARLIRLARPDVVIENHGVTGGHAQHQTNAMFMLLGIKAAKDPNYKVYDVYGKELKPWTVKRVLTLGGTTGGTVYLNRVDPFFPRPWLNYAVREPSTTRTWTNPTYNMISNAADQMNSTQVSGYVGQSTQGTPNNTALNYTADTIYSAPGYTSTNWQDNGPNATTFLAGIDTSINRVNKTLPSADQLATESDVQALKTALENVYFKFPNGPGASDWDTDRSTGTDALDLTKGRTQAQLGKTFIANGAATAADVQNQINLVKDDLINAAVALTALEAYAATLDNMADGTQDFQRYLSIVRRNYNDFTSKLYGIKQKITLSDYDPSPGQTIHAIVEIECFGGAFNDTGAPAAGKVMFPANTLAAGLPTTLKLPPGSTATATTPTPTPYSRTGTVYGAEMQVRGFRYEYDVTLSPTYKEYTGPLNQNYDEWYNSLGAFRGTYPYGTSDYHESDWNMGIAASARNKTNINNIIIRYDRNPEPDNNTDQLAPHNKRRPLSGQTTFTLGAGASISVEQEVKVRLVPKLTVDIVRESRALLIHDDADPQTNKILVDITNNTSAQADGIVLTTSITPSGTGIIIADQAVSVPSKKKARFELITNIPGGYAGNVQIDVKAVWNGDEYKDGFDLINYTLDLDGVDYDLFDRNTKPTFHHTEVLHLYQPSRQKLAVSRIFDLPDDDIRIGVGETNSDPDILGTVRSMYRDPVKAAANCVSIGATELEKGGEWLRDNFDTIIICARFGDSGNQAMLNLNSPNGDNVYNFMERGGNLIVHETNLQFNNAQISKIVPKGQTPPSISGNLDLKDCAIYVEETMLNSSVYTYPNDLASILNLRTPVEPGYGQGIPNGWMCSDSMLWDNWFGQRTEWAAASVAAVTNAGYVPMFAGRNWMNGVGGNGNTVNVKPAIFGTTVPATIGDKDGNWTYTSVLWQNHFPAFAEGAIALYANLVSLGYKGTPGWAYSGKFSKDSQIIKSADVEITAPVANQVPDTAATVLSDNSSGVVSWSPGDAAFVHGGIYTASVTLTADDWYIFDATVSGVTINGSPATIAENTGKTITIEASMTATGDPPVISTASLPGGFVGIAYSETLSATGANPITWSVTVGDLPGGLTLNAVTGVISGMPTAAGTYNFTVKASNGLSPDTTASLSVVIGKQTQADLSINGLGGNYTYGDNSFDLSTEGGSGSGTVTYTSSDPSVASVSGHTVTIHMAGTFTITATQAADTTYNEAAFTSGVVTVSEATPDVSLSASGGATTIDDIILTATISKVGTGVIPGGTVTFKEGAATLGTETLDASGVAVFTVTGPISEGSHTYTAEYPGEFGCYNANSDSTTVGVGFKPQAILSITGVPAVITYGDGGFDFGYSGGSGSGEVTYSVPANSILSVTSGGAVTITGAGTVTVTAVKSADSSYNQATAAIDIKVEPRDIAYVIVDITSSRFYTGSQLRPTIDVSDGTVGINTGDYTNGYGPNVSIGANSGSITLTGQGNYTGTMTVYFDIEKPLMPPGIDDMDIPEGTIVDPDGNFTYPDGEGGIIELSDGTEINAPGGTVINTSGGTITFPDGKGGTITDPGGEETELPGGTVITIPGGAIIYPNKTFDITVIMGTGGNITPSDTVRVQAGEDQTFAITASGGYRISDVKADGISVGAVSSYTFTRVIKSHTIEAAFTSVSIGELSVTYFTVTFDTNGGNSVNSQNLAQNGKAVKPADPIKDGFVFGGWYSDSALTKSYDFNSSVTEDVTIYANWTEVEKPKQPESDESDDGEKTVTLPNDYTIETPDGKEPVKNDDGSWTLPGGGKIKMPKGNTITVPPGTVITDDGKISFPKGSGGGTITLESEFTFDIYEDMIIVLDPDLPLEYYIAFGNPFEDVKESDWFYDDVMFAYTHGLMIGTNTNPMLFSPNMTLSRGMLVTILYRMSGSPEVSGLFNPFDDVAEGTWYTEAVKWAAENGIVNGYGDGLFGPDDEITREQMVTILYRYIQYNGGGFKGMWMFLLDFEDKAEISEWAYEAVCWCVMKGIVIGKPGNVFDPQEYATRAETAAFIVRFIEIRSGEV